MMPLTRCWKWPSQTVKSSWILRKKWLMEKYLFKRKNSPSMWKEKANNILLTTFSQLFFSQHKRLSLSGWWGAVKVSDLSMDSGGCISYRDFWGPPSLHSKFTMMPQRTWPGFSLRILLWWEDTKGWGPDDDGNKLLRLFLQQSYMWCTKERWFNWKAHLWPAGVATLNVHRLNASSKIENWNKYSIVISIKNSPWASS